MGWFGQTKADQGDAQRLRSALVFVLEHWSEEATGGRAKRLDRLLDRLSTAPSPTGLMREIKAVVPTVRGAPPSPEYAAAARELVDTMKVTALLDEGLSSRIAELSKSIPSAIRPSEANRLAQSAGELRSEAAAIRKRAEADRMELAQLACSLTDSLSSAGESGESIGTGLLSLADSLQLTSSPEGLRELRRATLSRLHELIGESKTLRGRLSSSQKRISSMEEVISRQSRVITDMRSKVATDALTGVRNRGGFDTAFAELIRRTCSLDIPLALVLLDLDHFKSINDTHGHPVGDAVLQAVARCMQKQVRSDDVVARVGGEEFAILLPGAEKHLAIRAAERIRAAIEALVHKSEKGRFSISASMGVGVLRDGEAEEALYRRVDKVLYKAKKLGRNRVIAA